MTTKIKNVLIILSVLCSVFGVNAQVITEKWKVAADATTGYCSVRTATGYGESLFGNNYQAGVVEEWKDGALVASYDVNKFCADNNLGETIQALNDSTQTYEDKFVNYTLWTGAMMDDAGNLMVNVGTGAGSATTCQNWVLLPASDRNAMQLLHIAEFPSANVTPGRVDVPSRIVGNITDGGAYLYIPVSGSTLMPVMYIALDDEGKIYYDSELSWTLESSAAFDYSTNVATFQTVDKILDATDKAAVAAKTYVRWRGQGAPFTWNAETSQLEKNTAIPQGTGTPGMDIFKIGDVEYIVVPVKSATTGSRGSSVAVYNLADGTEVASWDSGCSVDYFVGSVQARVNADGKTANIYVCGYKDCFGILEFDPQNSNASITSITLDKTEMTLAKSQTAKLNVSVTTSDGSTVSDFTWTSNNTSVATVDAEGNVTAVATGTANITVKPKGNTSSVSCKVTVIDGIVADGISYKITSATEPYTVEIVTSNYSGNVVIPESVTLNDITYNVTSIAYEAFYNCTQLTSVTIPSSVTSIGNYAFYGCTALKTVKLSNPTPITFNSYIFYNLAKYNIKLYVPKGSGHAYSNATYWKDFLVIDGDEPTKIEVTVATAGTLGEEILKQVEYVDLVNEITISGPLNDDDYYQLKERMPNLTAINLQNVSVTTLPNSLFYNKQKLTSAVLPSTLINTGTYTFENCSSLTDVTLPEGLTTIGSSTFSYCEKLQDIAIPQSVTTIENSAFYNCSALKTVTVPENVKTINSNTFYNCTALQAASLPQNITTIGSGAFYNCKSLAAIELPSALTRLEYNAFYGCIGLTEVVIPAKVSYCDYTFYNCSNIKKITCYASVPPTLSGDIDILYNVDKSNVELLVPAWSVSEYKLTAGWDDFVNINALSGDVSDIFVTAGKLTLDESTRPTNEPNVTVSPTGKLIVNGTDAFSMTSYKQQHSLEFYPYAYDHEDYDNSTYSSMISNSSTMRADNVSLDLVFADGNYKTWAFVTMPFDCNMSDVKISTDAQMVIRYYDGESRAAAGASNWKDVTADMTLNAGQGYIIQLSDTATVSFPAINNDNKNRIFSNANISRSLNEYTSEFSHNRSWNYIGNPFQCYYDIRFLNYSSPITYYCGRSYVAVSPLDDAFILAPMQAFFVQKPLDASEITFDIEGRQLDATVREITTQASTANNAERKVFDFVLNDKNGACDKTRIVINAKMTLGYESSRDASKFMSDNKTTAQLYTMDATGTRYAINERPLDNGIVKVGFYAGAAGTYSIEMPRGNYNEGKVILIDNELKTENDLSNGGIYTFKSEAGYSNSRFEIEFSHSLSSIDGITDASIAVNASKNSINVSAPINSSIAVYNVSGQTIANMKTAENATAIQVENGMYIVNVNGNTYKVIVND